MLKKIEISTFEDRIPYLKASAKKGVYIVSDIKSKIQFQNFFLEQNPHFQTNFIQRASDFYLETFKTHRPGWRIISSSYLELLFKTHIQKTNHAWLKTIPGHQMILHGLNTFLPFLIHPEGTHFFETWIKQMSKQAGWINWYEPTKTFWEELEKNRLIEQSLIKYLLIDQPLKTKNQALTFDLSFSIDAVEAGLISTLSSTQDVTLLLPPQLNNPLYSNSHYSYSLIRASHHIKSKPGVGHQKASHRIKVRKCHTLLEEVCFVTEQLNLALKNGFKPLDLAVIAPDIGWYWPCLKSYLKKEKIPVKKGSRIPLLSFPQIQKWLSILYFHSGKISFENMTAFAGINQNPLNISKIKSKYYYCDRGKDIKDFPYTQGNKQGKSLSAIEFTKWIQDLWNSIIKKHPNSKLDGCISTLLNRISSSKNAVKKAKPENWLEVLENELVQEEFHIPNTTKQGIELMSVNAITSLRAKKVFIIGVSQSACHRPPKTFLNESESRKILQDSGFYCFSPDPSQREYEIVHFLNTFKGQISLSYSETGFDGTSHHPSRVWLIEQSRNHSPEKTRPPGHTAWGDFQQKPLEEIVKHSPICSADQIRSILNQDIQWPENSSIPTPHLSPSKIKDYATCPFIFLSKNILHLKETSCQDMDLDYKDYGQMMHEMFHLIKQNKIQNKQDVLNWIHSIKSKFHILNDQVWQIYSKQCIEKYFQFIEHEKTITRSLKKLKTIDTEWSFKLYWNLKKEKLDPLEGDILIEGRIDRIDLFQDEYLIIDYKSSLNNVVNISHWESRLDFQMPLYIGAVSLLKNQGTVSAALYLSYRDFRWKGFVSKHSELEKLTHHSRLKINSDKKDAILKNNDKSIQKHILNLKDNIFKPQPVDKKICKNCYWRNICRIPHLN